ncbi:MAG: M48 family metalloprotease, partial [Clostridium sp.]
LCTPILFIYIGILPLIEKKIKGGGLERIIKRGVLIYISYVIFTVIINFATDIFSTFIRIKLVGISKFTFMNYAFEFFKENFISSLVIIPNIIIFYYIYKTKKYWNIIIWTIISIMMLIGNYLYPYYEGITNNTKTIENKDFQENLKAIVDKSQLNGISFKEIKMSDSTSSINAYLSGIFNSKEIVIWDTSLLTLSQNELNALIAHEIGHYVNEDIFKDIIFSQIINLFVLLISHKVFVKIYKKDKRRNIDMIRLIFIINVFLFLTSPIKLAYSRYQETKADSYAMNLLENSEWSLNLELKTLKNSVMPISGEGMLKWIYYTHPTPKERMEKCLEWKEKNK